MGLFYFLSASYTFAVLGVTLGMSGKKFEKCGMAVKSLQSKSQLKKLLWVCLDKNLKIMGFALSVLLCKKE